MIFRIEVYNEKEKIAEDSIDLSKKFWERGINIINPSVSYTADHNLNDNPNSLAVSGGQILPTQDISRINSVTQETLKLNENISVNIQARYDFNDDVSKRWNIDTYVHIHNPKMTLNEKRLINVHSNKIHHLPDCKKLKILSWINGVEQPPIIAKKPILMKTKDA